MTYLQFYFRYLDKVKKFKNDFLTQSVKVYPHQGKNDNIMKKYVLTSTCRREFILSHFDNSLKTTPHFRIDCCDICTNKYVRICLVILRLGESY